MLSFKNIIIIGFIGALIYIFYMEYHFPLLKAKQTIVALNKELNKTKEELESCEIGAKVDIDSALNEQSFKETNETIKELIDEDKKLSDGNVSVINDEYFNWVF